MAEKFIEIEFEGEHAIQAKLLEYEERMELRMLALLEDLTDEGRAMLRRNAPVRGGQLLQHIERGGPTLRPGGADAIFGVKFDFMANDPWYPLYVEVGTGLYGPKRRLIYPVRSPRMVFYSELYRRVIRTYSVKGQKKNKRYFYKSWRELQIYAASRILTSDVFH